MPQFLLSMNVYMSVDAQTKEEASERAHERILGIAGIVKDCWLIKVDDLPLDQFERVLPDPTRPDESSDNAS